ncbi:hypothetical protein ElyMa_003885300 [Elysia marginata]|uniref:Uncharacterized protein n=1 Tax=Elysia marginata TaxID=1093978 RepID=A0AAV4FLK9_9GAST|nr:hypothetical protein ElyMa_003885300 [Elysia marginata]
MGFITPYVIVVGAQGLYLRALPVPVLFLLLHELSMSRAQAVSRVASPSGRRQLHLQHSPSLVTQTLDFSNKMGRADLKPPLARDLPGIGSQEQCNRAGSGWVWAI